MTDPASGEHPACITSQDVKCDALFADADGDGREDILLLSNSQVVIYHDTGAAGWRILAMIYLPSQCWQQLREALLKEDFRLVEPVWRVKDFELLGVRMAPEKPYFSGAAQNVCPNPQRKH